MKIGTIKDKETEPFFFYIFSSNDSPVFSINF